MPKLSFIGDLTVDIYPKLNKVQLGGSSLTCALWTKKLGSEPTILAAVGDDFPSLSLRGVLQWRTTRQSLSEQYLKTCKKAGINTDFIKILPGKTSSIEIFLDKNGERTWGEWNPGVLVKYHLGQPEYDFLKTQDAVAMPVYFKTKHLLNELLTVDDRKWKIGVEDGKSEIDKTNLSSNFYPQPLSSTVNHLPSPLIVVDFDDLSQFQKSTKIIEEHLPYIDIVLCGLDIVSDAEIIRKLRSLSLRGDPTKVGATKQSLPSMRLPRPFGARNDNRGKLFVITLNKNGSLAFFGNKVFRQKADKIKVINSTGAGDAFLAGFLVEYVKSKNVRKSLLQGTKTATLAISKHTGY